jgi:hypothetical protein
LEIQIEIIDTDAAAGGTDCDPFLDRDTRTVAPALRTDVRTSQAISDRSARQIEPAVPLVSG